MEKTELTQDPQKNKNQFSFAEKSETKPIVFVRNRTAHLSNSRRKNKLKRTLSTESLHSHSAASQASPIKIQINLNVSEVKNNNLNENNFITIVSRSNSRRMFQFKQTR